MKSPRLLFGVAALLFAACYSPSLPNGKQQCGDNGACPSGYSCGPDDHCYKNGQVPPGGADMAVSLGDLAMSCTAMTCKGGAKPYCDGTSGECVECITDDNCPSGKVCTNHACVPGCNPIHGCPDGGGMCNGSKMCERCMTDGDCGGGSPRCDTNTGNCVPCLPTNDNCPNGRFCGQVNGVYTCQVGCQVVTDCPSGDGGGAKPACCNHVCIDTEIDGKNCGGCGTDCGKKSCCGAQCIDLTADVANCGGCGNACAGQHATWSCAASKCAVTGCSQGFGDCNGSPADGCETPTSSDVANCGQCGMKCGFANAVASCTNGTCGIAMCNGSFSNCNMNLGDGCEVNTNSDVNNCGGCGVRCNLTNATAACVNGKCAIASCNNGFSDCDMNPTNGCEAATATDANNCGGCGVRCGAAPNASVGCVGSKCVLTACTNGWKDCDTVLANGCEVNITNDVNNCGGCGGKCALGAHATADACVNSACTTTACAAGFADCNKVFGDGCEINITNDRNNCNGCGIVCGMATVCAGGACKSNVIDTHDLNGMTEYPLDPDQCKCCGNGVTAKQTADAVCVLAGFTSSVSYVTSMVNGTNCYCWDCTTPNQWVNNCCGGQASRPLITQVTCQ